jgi:NAD(P)-dependent dehydrogenase (short-subunit alcohol dehydrogenase family)
VAHLAKHGAHVYMCARSLEKATAAITSIKADDPSTNIDHLQMDHVDLASVVAAAKHFLSRETALHGLVNNAGIMASPYEMTKDGHEIQWQTNYLAHWVLTDHLRPLMLQTARGLPAGSVRIVNLSSSGHLGAPKTGINFDNLALQDGTPWHRYGQSKLANILHAKTLHATYGPGSPHASRSGEGEIWTSSIHPGVVKTNLSASVDKTETAMLVIVSVMRTLGLIWTADKGSWNSLYCVAGDDMAAQQSGTYVETFRRFGEPWWQSSAAKNAELADKLEVWTAQAMKKGGWARS